MLCLARFSDNARLLSPVAFAFGPFAGMAESVDAADSKAFALYSCKARSYWVLEKFTIIRVNLFRDKEIF